MNKTLKAIIATAAISAATLVSPLRAQQPISTELELEYQNRSRSRRVEFNQGSSSLLRAEHTTGDNPSTRIGMKLPSFFRGTTGYISLSLEEKANTGYGLAWDITKNNVSLGGSIEDGRGTLRNAYTRYADNKWSFALGAGTHNSTPFSHGVGSVHSQTYAAGVGFVHQGSDSYVHFGAGTFPKQIGHGFGWMVQGNIDDSKNYSATVTATPSSLINTGAVLGPNDIDQNPHENKLRTYSDIVPYVIPAIQPHQRTSGIGSFSITYARTNGKTRVEPDIRVFPGRAIISQDATGLSKILRNTMVGASYNTATQSTTLQAEIAVGPVLIRASTDGQHPYAFMQYVVK